MKTLIAAIVTTMAFATSMAFATTTVTTNNLPFVPVNISGSITYLSSTNATKGTLKTVSFNTKSLIALLNASPTVTNTLLDVTKTNQIPAGSYFVWDIYTQNLIVTNKNGFEFDLYGEDPVTTEVYNYGTLEPGDYYDSGPSGYGQLIGAYSLNGTTGAGSEQDQTAASFYFGDSNGNEMFCYGNGTLNWTFGAVSNDTQQASVTVHLQPAGKDADVGGNPGITKGVNISGSGSSLVYALGAPFYLWWIP